MTIQKIDIRFGDKTYEVILEDGEVWYIDPEEPGAITYLPQVPGMKVTSIEDAKRLLVQKLKKTYAPSMTFSD
jgi:hypothetical protein